MCLKYINSIKTLVKEENWQQRDFKVETCVINVKLVFAAPREAQRLLNPPPDHTHAMALTLPWKRPAGQRDAWDDSWLVGCKRHSGLIRTFIGFLSAGSVVTRADWLIPAPGPAPERTVASHGPKAASGGGAITTELRRLYTAKSCFSSHFTLLEKCRNLPDTFVATMEEPATRQVENPRLSGLL